MSLLKMPKIHEDIAAHNQAALAPYFAFTRTLLALAAGLLGLSAPQVVATGSVPDVFRAQLSLWAMLCLGSAIVFGAVALYGETNIYLSESRRLQALLKKHKGNDIAAEEEAAEQGTTPPKYHYVAFCIQCLSLLAGVVLLVCSKLPTPLPPSSVVPVPPPTQTPAPHKAP